MSGEEVYDGGGKGIMIKAEVVDGVVGESAGDTDVSGVPC